MRYYAHTLEGRPPEEWEPLFTPACPALTGQRCQACESLAPNHGHLNKVAHLVAEFAAAIFPPGETRDSARQWAYLTGLWHDLGKFAPAWQKYLKSKAAPPSHPEAAYHPHTGLERPDAASDPNAFIQ